MLDSVVKSPISYVLGFLTDTWHTTLYSQMSVKKHYALYIELFDLAICIFE